MYSKCDLFCLLGNNVDRVSHFIGWQLIRLLHVFESVATQWVFTTVSLAKISFVVVSVGLLPLSLFALLSFGWWDANLAGGSASCLSFFGLVCGLVVMICHVSCDHLCPCWSFLDHSFFSCKDRALERDRPYQEGKKMFCLFLGFWCLLFCLARWQLNGLCIDPIQVSFVSHCRYDWCCHCINSVNLHNAIVFPAW